MDGSSFKAVLLAADKNQTVKWRTDFMVEHTGEAQENVPECPKKSHQNVAVSPGIFSFTFSEIIWVCLVYLGGI